MGIQNQTKGRLSGEWEGNCERCNAPISRFRGQNDIECHGCGANYNCFGQRLRDDLHTRINPSEYDDEIGDLEGDEMSYMMRNDF